MFGRVGLIVAGSIVGTGLSIYGVPSEWAAIIGMLPFAVEALNSRGPYEKTAHEIMNEKDSDPGEEPRRGAQSSQTAVATVAAGANVESSGSGQSTY